MQAVQKQQQLMQNLIIHILTYSPIMMRFLDCCPGEGAVVGDVHHYYEAMVADPVAAVYAFLQQAACPV